MRVLLVNQSNGVEFNGTPPLGILYLASALRGGGHEVDVYDQAAPECDFNYPPFDFIRDFSPDVVGFSLYTFGLPNTLRYIDELKAAFPDIKVVVGGHHATALPGRTMEDSSSIDCLVYGEGEVSFLNLLGALEQGAPLSSVNGIYYRDNGTVESTAPQPRVKDLDAYSFPANDLVEKYTYRLEGIERGKKILNLTASRGCPFSCTYCNKAVYGSSYRRRSPGNVVDEIEYMFDKFGYDEVMFHDELFTTKKSWMYELFEEMKTRKLSFPWRCLGRVGTVEPEDLVAMRENGCYFMAFGLEAGNETVRADIGRKMSDEDIKDTFAAAKKAGLVTYAFNMINHRLDTIDTMRDTFALMCEVGADFSPVFICSPLPGSPINDILPEDVKYDWERFNSYRDFGAHPISICSVDESELMTIASQMEAFYFARTAYLLGNVLSASLNFRTRRVLFKHWLGYLLVGRTKHLASDKVFITEREPSRATRFFARVLLGLLRAGSRPFRNHRSLGVVYKKLTEGGG